MARFLIGASIAFLYLLAGESGAHSNELFGPSEQNQTQGPTQTKAAELAEANRLIGEVLQLYKAGKYDEALPIAKRAVEISEKVQQQDQRLLTAALGNLAELYLVKQDYNTAERLFERYLKIYQKVSGPDDPGAAKILEKLALVSYRKGDFDRAEKSYQRSLAINEKVFKPDHADVVRSLYNLAVFYQFRRDFKKAQPLYERLIANMEKILGPTSGDLAEALERYACVLRNNGEKLEADKAEARADAILFGTAAEKKETIPLPADIFGCRVKAIQRPIPSYPAAASRAGVAGTVIVEVVVNETGDVVSAQVVSGHPLLSKSAEKAALGAKYSPVIVAGQPVSVKGMVQYHFNGVKVDLYLVLVPGIVRF